MMRLILAGLLSVAAFAQTITTINNEAMSTARTKINDNFSQLNTYKVKKGTALTTTNAIPKVSASNEITESGILIDASNNMTGVGSITVSGSGASNLTAIAAPGATPAAGTADIYIDSTAKTFFVKDDAGAYSHTVKTKTRTGTEFFTAVNDAGTFSAATIAAGDLPAASDTAVGGVELTIASEVTTGTDTTRAVTASALAGSTFGKRVFMIEVFADDTAVAVGDGKFYMPVPSELDGYNIVSVSAHLGSVNSSSGAVNVDLARCAAVATGIRCSGTVADILSTNLTVDADEDGSETAAVAAGIDTANDDLPAAGHLRVDVDGAGTATKGLVIKITVQKT